VTPPLTSFSVPSSIPLCAYPPWRCDGATPTLQLYLFVELITTVRVRPPGAKPRVAFDDDADGDGKGNSKGKKKGDKDDRDDQRRGRGRGGRGDDDDKAGEAKDDDRASPDRRSALRRSNDSNSNISRLARGDDFRDSKEMLRLRKRDDDGFDDDKVRVGTRTGDRGWLLCAPLSPLCSHQPAPVVAVGLHVVDDDVVYRVPAVCVLQTMEEDVVEMCAGWAMIPIVATLRDGVRMKRVELYGGTPFAVVQINKKEVVRRPGVWNGVKRLFGRVQVPFATRVSTPFVLAPPSEPRLSPLAISLFRPSCGPHTTPYIGPYLAPT